MTGAVNHGFFTKVCGLTRFEDARLATELGASALGFILYPPSPRALNLHQLRTLITRLENEGLPGPRRVGVFVNESLQQIVRAVREGGIDTIQLHGNESKAFCLEVKQALPGTPVIKALRLARSSVFPQTGDFAGVDYLLVDSLVPGQWGGSGVENDFELVADFVAAIPTRSVLLSGGLHPGNVEAALQRIKPAGLDVSSGLEVSPGVKDAEKMKLFFTRIAAHV